MSLRCASQHITSRGSCLKSSYAEISRFIRTRHHGIPPTSTICMRNAVRCFASSSRRLDIIELDEKLRKALEDYKETVPTPWKDCFDNFQGSASFNHQPVGKQITLCGYLSTRRDVNKKLSFTNLLSKNQRSCIQLVSTANDEGSNEAEAHDRLKMLREWTPVVVKGTLKARAPPPEGKKSDPKLAHIQLTYERELSLESIVPLNEIPNDVIIKDEAAYGLEQRHLQLRTNREMRESLLLRMVAMRHARDFLRKRKWNEIETPLLFKSTPEGAREFLVPTRNKGMAYALPQSPQQYKQILMASGFPKYFQFAKCFRDEDQRADRQPEFTQLDLELSFAGEKQIMAEIENLLKVLWHRCIGIDYSEPFTRMTYHEAMSTYGSDKPDMRFASTIHNITRSLPADLISKITSLENPTVDAFSITLSDDVQANRAFISEFFDSPEGKHFLANPDGEPAVFFGDASQPMGGLGPLGHAFIMERFPESHIEHGDLYVLQAREDKPFSGGSTMLGNLRLALHKAAVAKGLVEPLDPKSFSFLWVTDFPLFSPSNDTDPGQGGAAGLSSTHHPFTAPKTAEDVDLLLTDPTKATAAHYDIVVNGVELGGGSRRIHNADVQEFIFRDVLKMRPERIEDFRHLLDVLRSGCPPHAGIALGWDRLIAVMLGKESVRDVIAFPKSGSGEDMLVKAPNRLTEGQLDTYHLRLKD